MESRWPLSLARLLGLLLAAALSGCVSAPAPTPSEEQRALADTAYGLAVHVATREEIFGLSQDMRAFLQRESALVASSRRSARPLVQSLSRQGQLRLEYDASRTRTAAEAFEARAGNCLSLVVMTAALARELGLTVRFQEVEVLSWERNQAAALDLRMGHVNLLLGLEDPAVKLLGGLSVWLKVDFLPSDLARSALSQEIDEDRVVAMVLNNRAGEALIEGDLRTAYWHARAAVRTDPRFAHAWNTLGVVHSRQGLQAQAEAALRLAWLRDGAHDGAMNNLAELLQRQGRHAEAAEWFERHRRLAVENPLALIREGQAALDTGDIINARRLLLRALKKGGAGHELHFALARTAAAMGRVSEAEQQLALAQELGSTPTQRQRYANKLQALRTSATSSAGPSPIP